ncbi:hypothetical protein BDZ88DRAFT_503295 [Geranomyces variabilis]|nr:hypothetical protein BDZ88DRAFT_503295 [Geranomyces variabilis]KAJ3143083.1 hypothetical protein HDU90_002957 [Geranomyces variabilis]
MADSNSTTPGDAYQQDERYNRASAAGGFLSLIMCFIVLVLFALIYCYQRHLYQRLSFRLVLAGTICGVFYAIAYVVSTKPRSPDDNPLCVASMFIQEVFLLGSLFCTTSVSMNLLLVFVIKVRSDRPYEKIYFATSAVLAFVVPMSALIAGRFGFDGSECWYILDEADDSGWDRKTLAWECVLRANLVYRHYLRYLTQRKASKYPAKRKKTSLMMYHFVRLCLLRKSDVDRMAKKAQVDDAKRAARKDAGKSPSETRSALGTVTSPSQSRSALELPSVSFLTTQRAVNLLLTESSTTDGKQPEDAREELNRL